VGGGAGMAQALGVKFLQNNGQPVPGYCGGGTLDRIASIDISRLDPRVREAKITIASDVDNPLCGPKGAARVFGPQKGATPDMVAVLDRNLNHFAKIIKSELGVEVATLKGRGRGWRAGRWLGCLREGEAQEGHRAGDRGGATRAVCERGRPRHHRRRSGGLSNTFR